MLFAACLLALAYCGVAGWRCACVDEDDYDAGVQRNVGFVMLRGMLWPLMLVAWLAERPVQLLLPPPGESP